MFRLTAVFVVAWAMAFVAVVGCTSESEVRGVYLQLPGDGFESNEIQRELTT